MHLPGTHCNRSRRCSHLNFQGFTRAGTIYTTARYPFVPVQARFTREGTIYTTARYPFVPVQTRVLHLFVPVQCVPNSLERKNIAQNGASPDFFLRSSEFPIEKTHALVYAMACVQSFKAFLKSRETGLIQNSAEWVKARQETVGASEIFVLTGSSPFETKETLISKKICTVDMSKNVACTWGFLFEPIVRRYFEEKYSVKVFGHTMSLNLAKGHTLYGKVTCSPDGYFICKDESIALLEFKCPYKRKIAVYQIPRQYADQIQTGLALSGKSVNKGLYVDACFRMCSFQQLGLGLEHNPLLNGGAVLRTNRASALACGVCLLSSNERLFKNQNTLL